MTDKNTNKYFTNDGNEFINANRMYTSAKIFAKYFLLIFMIAIYPSMSYSDNLFPVRSDSLSGTDNDTVMSIGQDISFKTFRIKTDLNEEQDYIKEKLYNFQYELGIIKGMELQVFEIYIDKTPSDQSLWNVIINDTTLNFTPSLPWNSLSEDSKQLLDNWSGRNVKSILLPDNVDSIAIKKNVMFRVMAVPIVSMGDNAKLSTLQKDYSYEIIIVDDYPEQVEIQPKPGLVVKRLDNNRFRIKLSRFNRAEFDRWAENRDDDPYIYITSITLYDKISNQKSLPINLKYTFGEY